MRILLVVYDNESFIHFFPQGIAYIAAVIKKEGIDVEIYSQDIHHYSENHLTDYLDSNSFDLICIGVIAGYYQFRKLLSIAKAINASCNRPEYFILGGHGPSPEPEYFLEKTNADIVVCGEGEKTIIELCRAISRKESLKDVLGIAYKTESGVEINEARDVIRDVDSIPWPEYDLFDLHYYRLLRLPHSQNTDFVMPVLTARGCPYRCNFCYRMDKGYRMRSPEAIVEEIRYLQLEHRINYVDFSDELLMSSPQRVEELCIAFKKNKHKFKWYCNGRLNFARSDILRLMGDTGCVYINYGIEAFDDQILKNMNKKLTTKEIVAGIEATLDAGISPGFNIIFGNIGENIETLKKGVAFLLKYDDCSELRTIRPVTPYPGSPLYYYAIEKGLLKDVEDFYEKKHVNSDLLSVNLTCMSDDDFHASLMEANVTLFENYYKIKLDQMKGISKELYVNKDVNFRGYRQS